jgi:regulator of sigma E protease
MEILSNIFYLIIVIAILVLVHEFGHFLAAKLFKMRVEKFSIGFGPRMFGKQVGETEYRVSWLPLGGYVKISGMIDESFDTEHLRNEVQPWEYRAKPRWQRAIVISAGVAMNFLLALFIFWGLALTRGREVHETTTAGYVKAGSLAESVGVRAGDAFVSVDGERFEYWEDVDRLVSYHALDGAMSITVQREGRPVNLAVPATAAQRLSVERFGVWGRGTRARIVEVESDKPADKAGLRGGDVIRQLNDSAVRTMEDVTRTLTAHPGTPIAYVVERGGQLLTGAVTPNEDGRIGIQIRDDVDAPARTISYSFFAALGAGATEFANVTMLTVQNLWNVATGRASFKQSIGGPVRIAKMATQQAQLGIASFLLLLAVISIGIAILNLFPFPVLDGGHLVYLLYEAIFRREIPAKVHIGLQYAGMIILMTFMLFVLYNDIVH